ncbi:MAG TPA: hypothetical protein PLS49_02660 [Candidatus Woesebacteria bacterium]|nr:hypothetical protein [Candidatus Woesebacteria bacterium]
MYKKLIVKKIPTEKKFFENNQEYIKFRNAIAIFKDKYKDAYRDYVNSISTENMAASLELASCIYALCKYKKPLRVLDLGSGFSSFVLRTFKKEESEEMEVISVDDSQDWLNKTRDYLYMNHLSTDHLLVFEDFIKSGESQFDLVLHDMNFVEVRKNYIEEVINRTSEGGLIIFDDVHKIDYFFELIKILKAKKIRYSSFRKSTLDKFKRFSIIAIK